MQDLSIEGIYLENKLMRREESVVENAYVHKSFEVC